jgi:hypothetical protein
MLAAGHFDLEAGLHDIGRATAVLRLGVHVSLGVQMVVGPPKIFKPFFVWAVRLLPQREARRRIEKKYRYGTTDACRSDAIHAALLPFELKCRSELNFVTSHLGGARWYLSVQSAHDVHCVNDYDDQLSLPASTGLVKPT